MKLVIQRVREARVTVAGETVGRIGRGAVILVGVSRADTPEDVRYLAHKTAQLRVYDDEDGRLNKALAPGEGAFLVVSQFTLYGDCRHGNRPGYIEAAPPEQAAPMCEAFAAELEALGYEVQRGRFRETMLVEIANDGPVTILMESTGRAAT
ncbi:MAG TPA: D-aminoacyl-tRNA deacylase [Kiritimatiellia bacterium]|nr:D-aminoacyl-tRNA deacylase [Kiritimatiellia bacterium]HSA19085.1 D-aminoacyl-tRNA deacylase [Kiritimatiellia bacterium]